MWKAASPSHSVSGGPGAPATTSPCRVWPLLPDGPNPTCRPSVCHHSPLILGSFSKATIPLASGHSMDWFLLVRHLPLVSASYSGGGSRCSHQQETKQPIPWTGMVDLSISQVRLSTASRTFRLSSFLSLRFPKNLPSVVSALSTHQYHCLRLFISSRNCPSAICDHD